MRIALVVNGHRDDAVRAACQAAEWLAAHGVEIGIESELANSTGLTSFTKADIARSDYVLSFGGDGTLIRAAEMCSESGTPILGVYYGTFGFVTQVEAAEVGAAISLVLEGNAPVESRMMLQAELLRNGEPILTVHALNEIVLHREVTSRMMVVGVSIDGKPITAYPSDGVLVATPTGSTAYNLSAGGPIVDPNLRAMILTAIAPHTLSARPLVLNERSEITLSLKTGGDAALSVDGQSHVHLLSGDVVRIKASDRTTRLVSVESDDFLEKLSNRLFYGINPSYPTP